MTLPQVFLLNAAVISAVMLITWLISLVRRDVSIIDIVWGLGFVAVAWATFCVSATQDASRMLLPVLVSLWGIRLGVYLGARNHGQPEDYRYRQMRERWGRRFPAVSLVTVFALQGAVMWLVSLPVQVGISHSETSWSLLTLPGTLMFLLGLSFETIGDWQLAAFRRQRKDSSEVLDTGLWRYTRHPNYFGDFLVWWGLFLVSFSQTGIWWTAVSPALMSVFLMKISGVTLLEKSLKKNKPAYTAYASRTSSFFPWPPGKPVGQH